MSFISKVPLLHVHCNFVIAIGRNFQVHVSSLPTSARPHLEQPLDWDHQGVDKDLIEIAQYMLDWEEKLCGHLGLTAVEISDIKNSHCNNPQLQR